MDSVFVFFVSATFILICDSSYPCPKLNQQPAGDQLARIVEDYDVGRPLLKFPGRGGSYGGSPFDDFTLLNPSKRVRVLGISSIDIGYSTQINAIQVTYMLSNGRLYKAPNHGKFSSERYTIKLNMSSNEYVSNVEVQTNGFYVDQLKITTSIQGYQHRVYGPFGTPKSYNYTAEGYILGFHGRSGDELDNVGVYAIELVKKSQLYGVPAGNTIAYPFSDNIDWPVPAVVGISKVRIWHSKYFNALQVEYLLLDGSTLLGKKHGGEFPGNLTTIKLKKKEQIIQVFGKMDATYYTYLNQISFITRDRRGVCTKYGPFGIIGGNEFEFSGNVYGFYGTISGNVYGIGFYYI